MRTGFGGKIGPSIQSRCRATAAVLDIETEAVQNSPSYCSGCGVKLQQDDPDLPGYVILTALENYTDDILPDSKTNFACLQILHYPKAKGAHTAGRCFHAVIDSLSRYLKVKAL